MRFPEPRCRKPSSVACWRRDDERCWLALFAGPDGALCRRAGASDRVFAPLHLEDPDGAEAESLAHAIRKHGVEPQPALEEEAQDVLHLDLELGWAHHVVSDLSLQGC